MLLKKWILDLEAQGHPVRYSQLREQVLIVLQVSSGPEKIGRNWVSRFVQRHPDIKSKIGKKMDYLRLKYTTVEALSAQFDLFLSVRQKYKVKTENIWNMDETGVALGVCDNYRVIGTITIEDLYKKSPENREWTLIIECILTTGSRVHSLIIFK